LLIFPHHRRWRRGLTRACSGPGPLRFCVRVRYHLASRATPLKRRSVRRTLMSRSARWLIISATAVTIAIVFGPGLTERIESYLDAQMKKDAKDADRLLAPIQAYSDEFLLFRRQARTLHPDPSLVSRAHKFLATKEPVLVIETKPPTVLDSPIQGDAIHFANLYLGRVALSQGNIPEARNYLLLAGKTAGSTYHGPDMTLADELLRQGQSEAVLHYLHECQQFWIKSQTSKLEEWTKDVRAGMRPDFGKSSGISAIGTPPTTLPNSR
jgi:hypothetical protein